MVTVVVLTVVVTVVLTVLVTVVVTVVVLTVVVLTVTSLGRAGPRWLDPLPWPAQAQRRPPVAPAAELPGCGSPRQETTRHAPVPLSRDWPG